MVKILDETPTTALEHLDQECKGLQSSKSNALDTDYFPPQAPQQTNAAIASIVSFCQQHKAFFDLMAEFPYLSSCSNKYLLVLYDHDSKAILTHPLKTRQGAEIKQVWMTLHDHLALLDIPPRIFIMDNEASSDLKRLSSNTSCFISALHHICTVSTQRNKPFGPSRIFSLLVSARLIPHFLSLNGTIYCHKWNWH